MEYKEKNNNITKNTKNLNIKFIVCDVILDEIKDRLPKEWTVVSLEKKLHEKSDNLRQVLQEEINKSQDFGLIILGYGLCGKSVVGLISEKVPIVLFKCDDCISVLLGSTKEYKKQISKCPGTYYLTRGYIGDNDNAFLSNYEELSKKYDSQTLQWVIKEMLKNYKRLVFINTGNYDSAKYREFAINEAEKLGLEFEELKGTDEYFQKLLGKKWDNEFLIVEPGKEIKMEMFLNQSFSESINK